MGELPFTVDQFLLVFEEYNRSIWPAQVIAYAAGMVLVVLAIRNGRSNSRVINRVLALLWIWMGVVYHIAFFTSINTAAYIFGIVFILQGVAFILVNRTTNKFYYGFRNDSYGYTGSVLVLYAMIIYPLLGYIAGHIYPQAPVFGVAPCPTTIFTFGLLLWTSGKVPVWLLVIPGLWSLVGVTAAFRLGIYEDTGLAIAGLVTVALLVYRNRRESRTIAYRL